MKFKEGQVYISNVGIPDWWTKGKEYEVVKYGKYGKLTLIDDEGLQWCDYEIDRLFSGYFELLDDKHKLDKPKEYIYVLIDMDIDVVICVGSSRSAVLREAYKQDEYFETKKDFYEYYDEKYLIEIHEVLS